MKKAKNAITAQNERMAAKLNYFNTAPATLQEKLALDAEFWRDDVQKPSSSSASAPTFSAARSRRAVPHQPDGRASER